MCCHHCNYWGHVNSKCGLRKRCTRCASPQHASIDCSNAFSMPSAFPVNETLALHTVEHPLITQLREEDFLLDREDDVSSAHTAELFGDVEDFEESDAWPVLPSDNSQQPSQPSSPPLFSQDQPAVLSETPLGSVPPSSKSPSPFQRKRERRPVSSGCHGLPFDDSLSGISIPSFSNVLRGAAIKRGPMDVPLEFVTLKKKQPQSKAKKKGS